ncbi:MAG: LysR family transcriptional regulator [Myxococcota bacterium]
MNNWDDFRLFLHAAEAGSLARGAQTAGCSTATMSRRLGQLESRLGLRLVHRHSGGITLTPEGERLLPAAQGVAEAARDLRLSAGAGARQRTHHVAVSTAETVVTHLIAPRLAEFADAHPSIRLSLRSEARIVSVSKRKADLALRLGRPIEPGTRSRRVAQADFGLFASERYVQRHGHDVSDLAPHRVVLLGRRLDESIEHQWVLERLKGGAPWLRVSTISAMARSVESGAVLGLLPRYMGSRLQLLAEPDLPPRDIWLVMHEDLRNVPHIRATAEFLARCVEPLNAQQHRA